MNTALRPVRPHKLGDLVLQQIQEKVSLGIFKPGEKIPTEPELMAQLGVGRSTVREAIRVLVSAGVLEVRQGDGTYVLPRKTGHEPLSQRLRRATSQEVYEVRRIIEVECARLAALHRTEADLRLLEDCLARREQAKLAGDAHGYVEADVEFHTAVAAAGGNSLLADLYRSFGHAFQDLLDTLYTVRGVNQSQGRIHRDLLDAIIRQDPEAAARHVTEALEKTHADARVLAR